MVAKTADLILTGGTVITLDAADTVAEAIAVADGRILAVGSEPAIAELAGPGTERRELKGKAAVPGLIDGHAHMDREGLKTRLPSLAGARSIDDILDIIATRARLAKPGEWIVTMPIGEPPFYQGVPDNLAEKRFPTRHELDRAAPDNPVYIRAIWGHWRNTLPLASIANTMALELAGITRDTVPPAPGIQIDKDFATGAPNGIFYEWIYKPVVEKTLMNVAPRFTSEDRREGLRQSMRIYNGFGTTSVFEGHGIAAEVLMAYRALREEGPLPVRAHLLFSPSWRGRDTTQITEMLQSWGAWLAGRGLGDTYLRMGGLYTEADVSLENALRAQVGPYTGWAGFNFDACLPEATMVEMMIEAARNDIRIGSFDANILALYERVDRVVPIAGKRWVIEHIGVFDDDQIKRIRDLGLVLQAYTNKYVYQDGAALRQQLGAEAEDRICPLRSLLDAGVHVSLATDNVPPTLFEPVWHAVAREAELGGKPVGPSQALSRTEALACASREGAYLTFEEDDKGTLEAGKFADIAVLSEDPLTVDQDRLRDIRADLTIVGGAVVFEREPSVG